MISTFPGALLPFNVSKKEEVSEKVKKNSNIHYPLLDLNFQIPAIHQLIFWVLSKSSDNYFSSCVLFP